MDVREAAPEDAEAVRDVHFASIKELGSDGYSQIQVDAWAAGCKSADYKSAIESDDLDFIVTTVQNDVVAFGSLKASVPQGYQSNVNGEITGIYVHPSLVRQGVGSNVLTELERRARNHSLQRLGLKSSLNAVAFYEAHGYQRVREHAHEFSSHESTGVEGTVVEMNKRL